MGRRRPKTRHSATEYFLAALGLAIVALVVAVVAAPGSCRMRPSPELGLSPSVSRPTPTPR